MNRSPLKVTKKMLEVGAHKLAEAIVLGHNPHATVHIIFTAMLAESLWSPDLRTRAGKALAPSHLKPRLTRADFDKEGVRIIGTTKEGEPVKSYIFNYYYLRKEFQEEKARERAGLPPQK